MLRSDAAVSGILPDGAALALLDHGARIILTFGDGTGGVVAQVYETASDAFSPVRPLGLLSSLQASAAPNGTILVGAALFDSSLDLVRRFHPPGQGHVGCLSRTGGYAYFAHGAGYLRTRIDDGVTLEHVLLPEPAERLSVVPTHGGPELVLAVGAGQLVLLDGGEAAPTLKQADDPSVSPWTCYETSPGERCRELQVSSPDH